MANCLRAIDNNPTAAVRAIASIGKSSGKLRSVVNIAKGVLKTTGYGLLAEAAFAAPFAIADLISSISVSDELEFINESISNASTAFFPLTRFT